MITKEAIEWLEFIKQDEHTKADSNTPCSTEIALEMAIKELKQDGWHLTSEKLPEIPDGDNSYVYIQCWDSPEEWMTQKGIERRVYPLMYCRRTVRGKTVERFESHGWAIHRVPEYWRYLSNPPKEVSRDDRH